MFSLICTLNKRLSKQTRGWWLVTPSRSLWRHCNAEICTLLHYNPSFALATTAEFPWRIQNGDLIESSIMNKDLAGFLKINHEVMLFVKLVPRHCHLQFFRLLRQNSVINKDIAHRSTQKSISFSSEIGSDCEPIHKGTRQHGYKARTVNRLLWWMT